METADNNSCCGANDTQVSQRGKLEPSISIFIGDKDALSMLTDDDDLSEQGEGVKTPTSPVIPIKRTETLYKANAPFPKAVGRTCYSTQLSEFLNVCKTYNFMPEDLIEAKAVERDFQLDNDTLPGEDIEISSKVSSVQVVLHRNLSLYDSAFFPTCINDRREIENYIQKIEEDYITSFGLSRTEIPKKICKRLSEQLYNFDDKDKPDNTIPYKVSAYKNALTDVVLGIAINYCDHIQFFAFSRKTHLSRVVVQLVKMVKTFSNLMIFSKSHIFGYLTHSTEYVGAGLQIIAELNIPILTYLSGINYYLKDFYSVCITDDRYSTKEQGILTVVTQNRMDLSPNAILPVFIHGINFLCNELEPDVLKFNLENPEDTRCTYCPAESVCRLVSTIQKHRHLNYTKKYTISSLVNNVKDGVTKFGGRLSHCIRINALHRDVLYPRVCDPHAYCVFHKFFSCILIEHNRINTFSHPPLIHYGNAASDDTNHDMVIMKSLAFSHRIRFVRNLRNYPFSMLVSKEERECIEIQIFNGLSHLDGTYYSLTELITNPENQNLYYMLQERHIIHNEDNLLQRTCGVHRDWPLNRGVWLPTPSPDAPPDEECTLAILVNDVEHLTVICYDWTGYKIGQAYNYIVKIMSCLDSHLKTKCFAKKPGLGFLTSKLNDAGTGMRLTTHTFLPTLGGDYKDKLHEFCRENQIYFQSAILGKGSPVQNHFYQIGNNMSMGISEYQTYNRYVARVRSLLMEEARLTNMLEYNAKYSSGAFKTVTGF